MRARSAPRRPSWTPCWAAPPLNFGNQLAAQERALDAAGARLRAGNALWGQRDLAWNAAFLARLASAYRAPLHEADFAGASEAARTEINAWVKSQTAGKIPELLTPGLVQPDTRLVLVNALHFKAPWVEPLTELGARPFTTSSGQKLDVPTLGGSDIRPWFDHDGRLGTALFCEGMDFALVLVQPKVATATAPVPVSVFRDVLAAGVAPVTVQLPAWKLKLRVMLTDILLQLGVRLAFDADRADFSGITDAERLYLDFVVHEATIEVNAKGIEAAAATAAGMRAAGAPAEPETLVLDRPFSYALMHVPNSHLPVPGPGRRSHQGSGCLKGAAFGCRSAVSGGSVMSSLG